MEEFIQTSQKNEKKRKQEYLIKHILNEGFADAFSEFLGREKPDGQEINNWTFEELESMVILFKRNNRDAFPDLGLAFKLEDYEICDEDKQTFFKRLFTPKKKKTVFYGNKHNITIDKAEILDSGFFGGQTVNYFLSVKELNIQSQRVEADFRWLHENLSREFPWCAIPPLMPRKKKAIDQKVLEGARQSRNVFLNDVTRHPLLRNSVSLETFVKSTKEEFATQVKELNKYFEKNLLIERGMTKKAFDNLGKEALSFQPSTNGHIDLKLSSFIKQYFQSTEGQFPRYEVVLDKLDKVAVEWDNDMRKLEETNAKMRDVLLELQSAALKYNTAKHARSVSNLLEDAIYSSVTNYFEQNSRILKENRKLFKRHVGDYFRYLRNYVMSMSDVIAHRSLFALENFKHRTVLAEKKAKKFELDKSVVEVDPSVCASIGISVEEAKAKPEIAKKLLFPDETIKLRKFTEVFAFVNFSVFKELLYFEEYLVDSTIKNFDELSSKSIDNIQKNHLLWAEIMTNFKDMKKIIAENKTMITVA